MNTFRAAARLVVVALLVAAAGACTTPGPDGPPGPKPSTTKPSTTTPLVEYTASGGLCPEGLCAAKVSIDRNGSWHASTGGRETDGQLDPAATRELNRRVEAQVSTLSKLPRGPELCPEAYDGSNITLTFHTGNAPVTVTNCDRANPANNREIPGTNPLLVYTTRLIADLQRAEPTPSRLLVEYHESGGHCMGACPEHNATIFADGRWSATAGTTSTSGQLSPADTTELTRHIQTQAGSLASLKPSSGCPSAYDGRDIEITFHTNGRTVKVSNCTKDFEGSTLLDHTTTLISGFF